MAITEAAQQNHDELFPGHVSTLKVTDPELIEYLDKFAFDEVLRHGDLDTRARLMVQLASMIASHAVSEFRVMLVPRSPWGSRRSRSRRSCTTQCPMWAWPRCLIFLHATNDVLKERGVELPLPGQSTTTPEDRAGRVGNNRSRLIDVLTQLLYIGYPRLNGLRVIDEVKPA